MYWRLAIAGLLTLIVGLAIASQPISEIASAQQPAQTGPPAQAWEHIAVPCTVDRPWANPHFAFGNVPVTTGVVGHNMSEFSGNARPPLRCQQPQTDAVIRADAQSHLDKITAAIAEGKIAYEGNENSGPKLYPARSFRPGELLALVPELLMTWLLDDDGSDILVVMDCYCNTTVLGLPLGYAEYVVLRYSRNTPGASYMTATASEPLRRLTNDQTIPIHVTRSFDDNMRQRLQQRYAGR
jgi:hypothetical protein